MNLFAPILIPTPTKTCPGANVPAHTLPTSLFAGDRSRADGFAPYCRECAATKQREWKRRNPEKVRAAKVKARMRMLEPMLA